MEQYGITELARLFGISTEALRKYEAKGLLESVRNEDNQFRKYDMWDIGMLMQIRSLREVEFSLGEISELIQSGELSQLETALRQKKEAAAEMILHYQRHFHMLEQYERNIHELSSRGNSFWLEYSPALYGIDIFDKTSMIAEENSLVTQWLAHTPTIFLCGMFDPASFYQRTILATEEENAGWLDKSKAGGSLQYFPSRLCACMMLGESYGNFLDEALRQQLKLLGEQGYRVDGDIIAKMVFADKKAGTYYAYHRVWIPVEKN